MYAIRSYYAFGMRLAKMPDEEIKQRVEEAARVLQLEPLLRNNFV